MTEGWWRELPEAGTENDLCFTPPKVWARVAPVFVRPQPTEHFVACDWLPLEKACIRWLMLLRYPDGVSQEEGEEWFLRVHAPEVAAQPGLVRFMSYKAIQDVGNVPGRWRPDTEPPAGNVQTALGPGARTVVRDVRRLAAVRGGGRRLVHAGPDWATQPAYPFVRPYEGTGQHLPARAPQRRLPARPPRLRAVGAAARAAPAGRCAAVAAASEPGGLPSASWYTHTSFRGARALPASSLSESRGPNGREESRHIRSGHDGAGPGPGVRHRRLRRGPLVAHVGHPGARRSPSSPPISPPSPSAASSTRRRSRSSPGASRPPSR